VLFGACLYFKEQGITLPVSQQQVHSLTL